MKYFVYLFCFYLLSSVWINKHNRWCIQWLSTNFWLDTFDSLFYHKIQGYNEWKKSLMPSGWVEKPFQGWEHQTFLPSNFISTCIIYYMKCNQKVWKLLLSILRFLNFKNCWFKWRYTADKFLSLRVFGLLSSSLLLFPQHFVRYVLRPSSGVYQTREPTQNFKLRPLLNPRGSPVLIPLAITGYRC